MTKNLPVTQVKAKVLLKIIKAAGPFLLEKCENLSKTYAQHQLRLAEVEALKELMVEEAKTIASIRRKLLEKYAAAPPDERFLIRRDLDDSTKMLRRHSILQRAIEHISQIDDKDPSAIDIASVDTEISQSWVDRFNELASISNEPWRNDLLARSLALESTRPGSTGLRALWLIGTLDEPLFHAFAAILDISTNIDGLYLVPFFNSFVDEEIPTCVLNEKKLNRLLFMVDGISLVGDLGSSMISTPAGENFIASYGSRRIHAKTKSILNTKGVILTPLGETISRLYEPKPNPVGYKIFENWLKRIKGKIDFIDES